MNTDAMVLRALLRLARRRQTADEQAVVLRVGAPPSVVRASFRRLDRQGLVERLPSCTRLTMAGLAVAVALLPPRAIAPTRRPARRSSRAA